MADDNASRTWLSVIPPEGDPKVGKKVFAILSDIIKDKENIGLAKKWRRNYELIKGQHWRKNTSVMGVSLVTANLINTFVLRTTNLLTDNNPTFNIARLGNPDEVSEDAYYAMQKAAEHWWVDQEQQEKLERSVWNGETYGIAIEKVVFDANREFGIGEVATIVVDPFQFGWWPTNLVDPLDLQQSEAVLHYYPMTVREAKRKWPDLAEEIKPDRSVLEDLAADRRELQPNRNDTASLMTTIGGIVKEVLNWGAPAADTDDEETLIAECWCKDYTLTEAGPKYKGFIRYIVVCNGGRIVLEDKSNPNISDAIPDEMAQLCYLYDKFPFSVANSMPDTSSAWGLSSIEQLEGINMEVDKSLSQYVLVKDKSARLKIVNPKTSGVQNHEFTNYPGILNPANSVEAQGIRYLEMPQLPVDISNAVQMFMDLFYKISGIFDIEQAKSQGSQVIAYKAIAALLENNSVMMKGKIRSYSRLVRERGRMFISMLQNFYTENRVITVQVENGEQQSIVINGQDMLFPAKLTVITGSTMPVSKIQQREEALALFKAGAIDAEDLLNKMEWSSRAEVVKRQKEGLYGGLMSRLQETGAPQGFTQYLAELALMDDKAFAKAVEQGKIPPFNAVLQTMLQELQQQQPQPTPDEEKGYAEIRKIMADVDKIDAERALTVEKIATERVEQNVRVAGIAYDQEMLKIERAKIVADLEKQSEMAAIKWNDSVSGYQEKGGKSNNKEGMK